MPKRRTETTPALRSADIIDLATAKALRPPKALHYGTGPGEWVEIINEIARAWAHARTMKAAPIPPKLTVILPFPP